MKKIIATQLIVLFICGILIITGCSDEYKDSDKLGSITSSFPMSEYEIAEAAAAKAAPTCFAAAKAKCVSAFDNATTATA